MTFHTYSTFPTVGQGMRATICLRRRRERREALAIAEREWVCGGPLVDISAPIIGGSSANLHALLVEAEIAERQRRVQVDSRKLAVYFAERCLARSRVRERMIADYDRVQLRLGGPRLAATHSTSPAVHTITVDQPIRRF